MYDFIGDVHGHAEELEALLLKLGYVERSGAYRHFERTAIFLGDLVDRGPFQKRVIEIVRSMAEAGSAQIVMGNHEFNAIAFFTEDHLGQYLRPRNENNIHQHAAFLDEFEADYRSWADVIEWFKELPLWLDFQEFRVVHACWDHALISRIEREYGGNRLSEDLLEKSSDKGTWQFDAIETILKGEEISLPVGHYFHDHNKTRRTQIRTKWWQDAQTYREAYIGPPSAIPNIPDIEIPGGLATKSANTTLSSAPKARPSPPSKPLTVSENHATAVCA